MWVYLSTTLAAKKGVPVLLGVLIILVGNSHGEQRRSISLGGYTSDHFTDIDNRV